MKRVVDVFNAFLVEGAVFQGNYEFPALAGTDVPPPTTMITFDKSIRSKKHKQWVHFYIHDNKFLRLWRNPRKYLPVLKKYDGVISPDFSIYRDMPLALQIDSTYRNRALGYWFEKNGIPVIPNVRWGDERTYEFCFDSLPKNATLAVGSHGNLMDSFDRRYFADGFREMIDRLMPHTVVVYGYAPPSIFSPLELKGIQILRFDNQILQAHRKEA